MKKRTETRLLVLKDFDSNEQKIQEVLEYLMSLNVVNYAKRWSNSLGFGGNNCDAPHLMIVFMDTKISFDVFLGANAFLLNSSAYGPVRFARIQSDFVDALGEPNSSLIQVLASSVDVQMSQHYSMS